MTLTAAPKVRRPCAITTTTSPSPACRRRRRGSTGRGDRVRRLRHRRPRVSVERLQGRRPQRQGPAVMNNDPEDDPALFAGKTRLYYGRWDYKYEQAAQDGARRPRSSSTRHPPPAIRGRSCRPRGRASSSSCRPTDAAAPASRRLGDRGRRRASWSTLGGQDLDALRAAAQKRDFRPVPLGVRTSVALKNAVTRKKTANVIGRLPGLRSRSSRTRP